MSVKRLPVLSLTAAVAPLWCPNMIDQLLSTVLSARRAPSIDVIARLLETLKFTPEPINFESGKIASQPDSLTYGELHMHEGQLFEILLTLPTNKGQCGRVRCANLRCIQLRNSNGTDDHGAMLPHSRYLPQIRCAFKSSWITGIYCWPQLFLKLSG